MTLAQMTAELTQRHLGAGRAMLGKLLGGSVEVSSEGPWVYTEGGSRFLDFGGYGVFILGHRHPRVIAAVRRQLETHPLASRVFLEPVIAEAAGALAEVAPPGLDFVHFVNSGAEAAEAAIKLARAHGRTALVSAASGFHGKTIGALSVTANPAYQAPFRPLLPDVLHVRFGSVTAMREALAARAGRACVIVEPVQGEAGVVVPPGGYLRAVARACREFGALLVVDEVQTGLGRLGAWWGADLEGVRPDVLLAGKGLSGGVVPIGAMIATEEAYEPFGRDHLLHTSTFGGSPLACAAAHAALGVMHEEDVVARAASQGARLLAAVRDLCTGRRELVREVRGRGLLIGVEFTTAGAAAETVLELLERGVLVNHSLNAARVLRLTPPALLEERHTALFLESLDAALRAVAGQTQYTGE